MPNYQIGTAFFKMESFESSLYVLNKKMKSNDSYRILRYRNTKYNNFNSISVSSKFYSFIIISKNEYYYYPSSWVYPRNLIKTTNVE